MSRQRARFSAEEVAAVLGQYDLGTVAAVNDFPRGAHSAAKAVVTTDRGKFLLKRRPKGLVDPLRVGFAHQLQRFLAAQNFPLPHLITARDDAGTMLKLDEAIYEVFEFIEGKAYGGGLLATAEAGKTLGLYHNLVRGFASEYEPPRGHYHDSPTVHNAFEPLAEALAKAESARGSARNAKALLSQLREAYCRAAQPVNDAGTLDWETQIVHADWHPGNLLFGDDHVVAVLDYDSARIRQRVMDVANGCLQFSVVTGGRDLATWEARTDHVRALRFLRGYDMVNVLSKAELRVIPCLMQEVLIAQAIPPILQTGAFAGLDGFEFLKVVLAKVQWLHENPGALDLDADA